MCGPEREETDQKGAIVCVGGELRRKKHCWRKGQSVRKCSRGWRETKKMAQMERCEPREWGSR